jgi:hypothetical protein
MTERKLTAEEKEYIARHTDHSAKTAWNRMQGYMALRMGAENKAVALGTEVESGGSFKPGPQTWREMDEFDGGREFRSVENEIIDAEEARELDVRQVHINRRREDSKRLGTFVRDALRNVTAMEQIYALCRLVEKFDEGTEARGMALKPLWEFVDRAFDEAERRVRGAERILAELEANPRTLAEKTNCLVLALEEHGNVSTHLVSAHVEPEIWGRMIEATRAGHYHIAPDRWGQKTLFMEVQ